MPVVPSFAPHVAHSPLPLGADVGERPAERFVYAADETNASGSDSAPNRPKGLDEEEGKVRNDRTEADQVKAHQRLVPQREGQQVER